MPQFGGISIPGVSMSQLNATKTALEGQITGITDAVAQGKVPWLQIRAITVPTLLLNASVDIPITWDVPAPGIDYALPAPIVMGTSAGNATATIKANSKSVNGVTITVKAGLAITLGSVYVLLIAGRSANQ